MADRPLTAPMPPDLDLVGGFVIRLTAVDPTSGALVAGVNITEASIYAASSGALPEDAQAFGPFMLVPGPQA